MISLGKKEDCSMKKTFVFAALALCAAALAVSCEKKDFDQPVETKGEMVTFTVQLPSADSKVAVDGQGKVTWEVGDKIHIHTGHNRSGEATTVELQASDISADGKSATIAFEALTPYNYSNWGDGYATYYAAYPADATSNPASTCYCRNYFSNTNTILMAACDNEGVFQFKNLCGVIAFEVTGSFDSYVFSGNGDEIVGYDTYVVEILPGSQNYLYKDTAGEKKTIAGDLNPGVNYICLPNGANLSGGFTIKFKDGEDIVKVAKTTTGVDIARNKFLNLGDITSKLEDYVAPTSSTHKSEITGAKDLSSNGTANCYMITEAGAYKFPVMRGNSAESAGNVFGAELLWETYNNAEEVTANSVIAAVDFDGPENYVYFKTPETLKHGNALIAAKNAEGEIIWSWHIWIPATTVTVNALGGIIEAPIMDRNLGALVAVEAGEATPEPESFGLLYQWGRKDPFLHAESISSSTPAKSTGSFNMAGAKMTVAESVKNPMTYVKTGSDSIKDWATESDNSLWSSSKTMYDPCPVGYKVAHRTKTDGTIWKDMKLWTVNTEYKWFKTGTTDSGYTVFPVDGYLDQGSITKVGTRAYVWTSYCSSADLGYQIAVDGSTVSIAEQRKSRAGNVRCVLVPVVE